MQCVDLFTQLDTITDGLVDFCRDEAELLILEPDTGRKFIIGATDSGEDQARITIDCRHLDSTFGLDDFGCDAFDGDVVIRLDVDVFRHIAVVGSTENVPVENRAELVNLQLAEISRYRHSPLAFIDRTPAGTQSILDMVDGINTGNLERIASIGYPTVEVYVDDDGETRVNWWNDTIGDDLMSEARDMELEGISDSGIFEKIDKDKCAIVDSTIDKLRASGNWLDLLELLDAASTQGSAFSAENAAGHFPATIAQLAWKQIKDGGAHHG